MELTRPRSSDNHSSRPPVTRIEKRTSSGRVVVTFVERKS